MLASAGWRPREQSVISEFPGTSVVMIATCSFLPLSPTSSNLRPCPQTILSPKPIKDNQNFSTTIKSKVHFRHTNYLKGLEMTHGEEKHLHWEFSRLLKCFQQDTVQFFSQKNPPIYASREYLSQQKGKWVT